MTKRVPWTCSFILVLAINVYRHSVLLYVLKIHNVGASLWREFCFIKTFQISLYSWYPLMTPATANTCIPQPHVMMSTDGRFAQSLVKDWMVFCFTHVPLWLKLPKLSSPNSLICQSISPTTILHYTTYTWSQKALRHVCEPRKAVIQARIWIAVVSRLLVFVSFKCAGK